MAYGDPPDLFCCHQTKTKKQAGNKTIQVIENKTSMKENFTSTALETITFGFLLYGTTISLPFRAGAIGQASQANA